MKWLGALALLAALPAAAAAPPRVSAALHAVAATAPAAPALVVAFRTPKERWTFAAGPRRIGGGPADVADASDPFRIASVTKSFTAAAIMRLVEDGAFALDDPIGPLLPPGIPEILSAGKYAPDKITVRQLLAHGSGLRDYATTKAYLREVGNNLQKPWTAREQIVLAVAAGPPLFKPGTRTRYSDTGFVLLGEILVAQTRTPLAEAVPRLLGLDRTGLAAVGWERLPPNGGSGLPVNAIRAAQGLLDMGGADPRFDYHGGGGIVASAPDLLDAFAAIVDGGLFRQRQTGALMQAVPGSPDKDGTQQALGLERLKYGDLTCFGHKGHWGTMAVWCPTVQSGFVFSVNQASAIAYRRAAAVHVVLSGLLPGMN